MRNGHTPKGDSSQTNWYGMTTIPHLYHTASPNSDANAPGTTTS